MPRFRFAFDSLKKMRFNKLLVARKELVEVEDKLRMVLEEHLKTAISRTELFDDRDSGILSAGRLQLTMDMVQSQTQKMYRLEKHILTFQEEVERHRNWVAHLGKELKIVEKLEENQKNAFEAAERTKEKRMSDRWVSERWAGKMAQNGEGGFE